MRIKDVTIQGMHKITAPRTYELNDSFSYLYGKNGAGKSTVLEAIQLALLGYIPGCNKTKDAIFRHANGDIMSVELTLRDSDELIHVTRKWINTGKSITSSVIISPEGYDLDTIISDIELPIFNFSEFIGMTANKLKDWFISFLPKSDSCVNLKEELTNSLKGKVLYDSKLISELMLDNHISESASIDDVITANSVLKTNLQFKKSELQRIESTIQSLVYYDIDADEYSEEDIQSECKNLSKLISDRMTYDQIKTKNQSVETMISQYSNLQNSLDEDEQYSKFNTEIEICESRHEELCHKKSSAESEIYKLDQAINKLTIEIKNSMNIVEGAGICPYSNLRCESVDSKIPDLKESVEEMRKSVESNQRIKQKLYDESSKIQNEMSNLIRKISEYRDMMINIEHKYERRDALKLSVMPLPELSDDRSVEELNARNLELTEMISKIKANQKYSELIDNLTSEKFKVDQAIEILKIWIKITDANGLQTTMMEAPFIKLADDISCYLKLLSNSSEISAAFKLSSAANSFSIGVSQNNQFIPYNQLSGGERCIYALALMMTIISKSKSPLKLLMIDDILDHLDDNNAQNLFSAVRNQSEIQCIFAGVKTCNDIKDNTIIIE